MQDSFPRVVRLFGRVIEVRLLQFAKAPPLIVDTPFSKLTDFRYLQLPKALRPISFTPEGIVSVSISKLLKILSAIEYEIPLTELIGTKEHMEEEFADVMVMLEQFKAYYELDNDRIVEIMYKKIDRQLERIANDR